MTGEDLTALRFDKFTAEGQTQTCPFTVGLGREEGLKNFFPVFFRDPRTTVIDIDQRTIRLLDQGDLKTSFSLHRLGSVQQNIDHDLA